jgi:predicted house-cleaning NTP pyrophosphatase (Maf/HAM1 superfamily)
MTDNKEVLLESQAAQDTQLTPAQKLLSQAQALCLDISQGTEADINERIAELLLACDQRLVEQGKQLAKVEQRLNAIQQNSTNAAKEPASPQTKWASLRQLIANWCNVINVNQRLDWKKLDTTKEVKNDR